MVEVDATTLLTAPFVYSWSTGSTETVLTNVTGGTYSLTITDANGCNATASTDVADGPAPILTLSATNAACPGSPTGAISITQLDNAVAPITYTWSNGSTDNQLRDVVAGVYTLTITDGGGCIAVASVTVEEDPAIEVDVVASDAACPGSASGSIEVTELRNATDPVTYAWSNGAAMASIDALVAGDYALTVTDTNGCTAIASATVDNEPAVSLALSATPVACAGEATGALEITLLEDATQPVTYQWSNGSDEANLTELPSGIYTLTVVDDDGCSATAISEVVEPEAPISLSATSPELICYEANNGILLLEVADGQAPYTFSLVDQPGVTTSVGAIVGLPAGAYGIAVVDANGCKDTTSADILSHPQLTLDLGDDQEINYGDSAILVAQHSVVNDPWYEWSAMPTDTSFSCDTCEVVWVYPTVTTVYALTIMDDFGCEITDRVQVRVANPRNVYVPTGFSPNDDGQNDFFYIFGGSEVVRIKSFRVFSRWGGELHRVEDFPANDASYGWDGTIDGQDAASDIYTWMAEIEFIDGRTLTYKGEVMLMR